MRRLHLKLARPDVRDLRKPRVVRVHAPGRRPRVALRLSLAAEAVRARSVHAPSPSLPAREGIIRVRVPEAPRVLRRRQAPRRAEAAVHVHLSALLHHRGPFATGVPRRGAPGFRVFKSPLGQRRGAAARARRRPRDRRCAQAPTRRSPASACSQRIAPGSTHPRARRGVRTPANPNPTKTVTIAAQKIARQRQGCSSYQGKGP
mmetsp:Transcript_17525/g.53650  ORF Transcript_17525/g.53650 Transcript_17525/m.53650 type:complete len:204 (-) Transcript_17525:90-701(-)